MTEEDGYLRGRRLEFLNREGYRVDRRKISAMQFSAVKSLWVMVKEKTYSEIKIVLLFMIKLIF
jgi:hypothetical protein